MQLLALNNIFELSYSAELAQLSEEGAVIIDIGAQKTLLVVYKDGGPLFTKEIQWGGGVITDDLQNKLTLNFEDAENIKCFGDQNGNLPEDVLLTINEHMENFLQEIKTSLNFYLTASAEDRIGHCFITGGSSLLPGMQEALEGILEINVEYFNPLRKIAFDKKRFSSSQLELIKATGAVSLGLAMRRLV